MTTTDYAEPAATLPAGRMPLLGFGTWQISDADAVGTTGALEAGYRHIDTATAYGNEAGIGKALASPALARGIDLHHHQAAPRTCRSGASDASKRV